MEILLFCGFFIFFSFLRSFDLNLSQILGSISVSEPLNLTLENNMSYYLDMPIEIKNENFFLQGDESMTRLSLQINSEFVLSFEKSQKIFFSKIFFSIVEKEPKIIPFVFTFKDDNSIIFENCGFYLNIKSIYFIFTSNCSQIIFLNCTLENSFFLGSFFVDAFSLDSLTFTGFDLKNSSLENSSFINGDNILFAEFLNITMKNNDFTNSTILNLNSQQQLFENFKLSDNDFKNDSKLIIFEQNQAGGSFIMTSSFFQNNYFESVAISIGLIYSFHLLNLADIIISKNFIKEKLLQIKCSAASITNIVMDNVSISFNNHPMQKPLPEIANIKEIFISIEGNFMISANNINFVDNICYLGPCAFQFSPSGINSIANIVSSIFSNNLVVYSDDGDIPTCLFFVEGSIYLIMQRIMMTKNSVGYINKEFQIENGEKGNPCLYSDYSESLLVIENSTFFRNSGYGDYGESTCILFKGVFFEIKDSLFLENFGPIGNRIFLFVLDCPTINLANISFIKSFCGTMNIYAKSEMIKIMSKNITIINNEAGVFSFFFILQKYYFNFENMNFTNNVCFYSGVLGTLKSVGENPENQKFLLTNCVISNNTSYETSVRTVIIEFYTIESYTNFTNCLFENNLGTGENDYGGAIYINNEVFGLVTFLNCKFLNNSATYGGVAYCLDGTLIVIDSYIKNNKARISNGAMFEIGTYSDFALKNCSLIENYGGIFKGLQRATFLITQNEFLNNLFLNEYKVFTVFILSTGSISLCKFRNLTGESNGFFLLILNAFNELLIFENNTIENCSVSEGSFFMINAAQIFLKNIFIKNIIGSLFFASSGNLILQNVELLNQVCGQSVCLFETILNSDIKINLMTISNVLSYEYEIFSISSSNLNLENIKFGFIESSDHVKSLLIISNSDLFMNNVTGDNFNQNFMYATKSSVTINEINLIGEINSEFLAIISEKNVFLNVSNSKFENFTYNNGGAIYNEKTYFFLNSSIFFNNKGQNGGAIYTYDSNVSFIRNSFFRNSANYGAAIYFFSQNLKLDLKLENNNFSFGIALNAGGGIFSVYSIPNVEGNIFLNNLANYGNDYATPPITLFFAHNEEIDYELSNYLPSSVFSNQIIVYLKDFYNNSIDLALDGKATLSLATNDMYNYANITDQSLNKKQIFGQILSDYSSKSFVFDEIKLNFKPNSTLLLNIGSDLINDFDSGIFNYSYPHYIDSNNIYNFLIEINSTECPLGYIFFENLNLCQKCSKGEYSLSVNDLYCYKCPDNAECNGNGSFINVLPGFWREDYFSTNVLECYIPEACLGNECKPGYEGPLCDTCIHNYFKQPQAGCVECESALSQYFIMAIMILLVIFYISFTLKVNMRKMDKEKESKEQVLNLYLRLMTDYFQVISTIVKIQVNFVYGIGDFFSKFSFISDFLGNFFSFFYPLDCFYSIFSYSDTKIIYLNLYFLMALYPFILLTNAMFWGITGYFTKNSIQWISKRYFLVIFLISYMVQPSFINAYFKYANCTNIDDKLYLKSYLVEKCWEDSHLSHFLIFILPSLIFWMIVYPCLVLYLLRLKNEGSIKISTSIFARNNNDQQMFSFFTDGLKENFYYWEVLMMFRKYVFIILSIFPLTKTLTLNLWVLSIFSFGFLFFQVKKKPYKIENAQKISLCTNIIVLIAVMGITVLFIENSAFNQMLFLSIFALLNIVVFVKWGYDIYILKKKVFIEQIQSLKKKIGGVLSKSPFSKIPRSLGSLQEAKVLKVGQNQLISNFSNK